MSDLFKFPEYPELEKYKEKVIVDQTVIQFGDVTNQLTEVNRILESVKSGQSNLVPGGAMQLPASSPCYSAIERFTLVPNPRNLRNMIQVIRQDISRRVATEVAKVFESIDKEATSYVN